MKKFPIKDIYETFESIMVSLVVITLIIVFAFRAVSVDGDSMLPNFEHGDRLIVNRLAYKDKLPEYEDIVIFYCETKNYTLIKRVIGMPGDTVKVIDNKLYINDQLYDEEYLSDGVVTNDFSLMELGYEKIPEDKYLVLGDNRENSLDSREIGLVNEKDIIGKISFRIWPLNKVGFPR